MKRIIVSLLALGLLLTGCSHNRSHKPKTHADDRTRFIEQPDKGKPEWYLYPPQVEDGIYGAAEASKSNSALGEMAASARARSKIAKSLSVFIETMLSDHLREAGIDSPEVTGYIESVVKEVSQSELKGSIIEKRAQVGKTWYVLVYYDDTKAVQLMSDIAEKKMQENEVIKSEYYMRKAEADLKQELEEKYGKNRPVVE